MRGETPLITQETRRESYDAVLPKVSDRKKLILEVLNRPMTAHEITVVLLIKKHIPYYDRNFVSPRLTELKKDGVLQVVGKRYCKRTERNVAVWERKGEGI